MACAARRINVEVVDTALGELRQQVTRFRYVYMDWN